jgi:Histidine kinase-, DNA gyrase B-, and HSP90-like ATPase
VDSQGEYSTAAGIEMPPVAPMLMESLRAVGYSTAAALADLIDNSVAAGARRVAVSFAGAPAPFVAILDDGEGMDLDALKAAMRYGSRDPRDARVGLDLGRFGLGMKTASLSQCRRMTVASWRGGRLSVASWDLDECERQKSWWLLLPEPSAVPKEVLLSLQALDHGTAVIWQKLDRMLEGPTVDPRRALDPIMDGAADHLALVFHRFLSGEIVPGFDITVNSRSLPRLDPFLAGHTRGQALHAEGFEIDGHKVTVSPFVLPFPSRLQPADLARAGGRESLKTGHGFYVYRGGRLVVPGGWYRIVPADDLMRLARVRVDVPVELDHLWKVDIRKTVAEPPAALRPDLRRIVGQATLRSRRVYTHKGTRQLGDDRIPLWSRYDLRDGAAAWRVNRDHPLVAAAIREGATHSDVERLLEIVEVLLPAHDIHLHISNDLPVAEPPDADLTALASHLAEAFRDDAAARRRLLEQLHLIDPFNRAPEQARTIAKGLLNDEPNG